jgi:hypothetical protein
MTEKTNKNEGIENLKGMLKYLVDNDIEVDEEIDEEVLLMIKEKLKDYGGNRGLQTNTKRD